MSNKPISGELEKLVRESILDQIIATKPYKANRKQFAGWTTHALQEELYKIEELTKNPTQEAFAHDFRKGKDLVRALKHKRMREEIVAAKYGQMRSVTRWDELSLVETYKKLEE